LQKYFTPQDELFMSELAPAILRRGSSGRGCKLMKFSPKSEISRLTSARCLNILLINGISIGDFLYKQKKSVFSILYRLYNYCYTIKGERYDFKIDSSRSNSQDE